MSGQFANEFWKAAIKEEFRTLESMDAWEIVD